MITLEIPGFGALSLRLQIGERAERRHERAAEVAPEGEGRRERRPRLGGAEVEESHRVPVLEGRPDASLCGEVERRLVRLRRPEEEVARWRQGDGQGGGHRGSAS